METNASWKCRGTLQRAHVGARRLRAHVGARRLRATCPLCRGTLQRAPTGRARTWNLKLKNMNKKKLTLNEELEQLEQKLTALIHRRITLLGKIAGKRSEKNKSIVDSGLEKKLWSLWKIHFKGENQRAYRQLFTILNSLSYARAEKKKFSEKPFCLYPTKNPLNVHIQGPGDIFQARICTFLAALADRSININNFPINDSLIELIKALNQYGAKLTWKEKIFSSNPATLSSVNKSIFVGQDAFNFYLLLCLSLGEAGVTRFTCASNLKILNLKPIQDILPQLGARLSSTFPQSFSLPARLEASGQIPGQITLPESIDPDFVPALCLAACTYRRPLKINLASRTSTYKFRQTQKLMQSWKIKTVQSDQTLTIYPGRPEPSENFQLQLDPLLGGYLLALPVFAGGKVTLLGNWPEESPLATAVYNLLTQAGLKLMTSATHITSTPGHKPEECLIDISDYPELAPLALPLLLSSKRPATLFMPTSTEQAEFALDLLKFLNLDFKVYPARLEISFHGKVHQKDPWHSPDVYYTLAYALISFIYRGICLANPGSVTAIWPDFWKIFQNLPDPQNQPLATNAGEQNDQPARRRIIVSGD